MVLMTLVFFKTFFALRMRTGADQHRFPPFYANRSDFS